MPAGGAFAQAPLRIFDAHLHYNQEPTPYYDLDKVLEIFHRIMKTYRDWLAQLPPDQAQRIAHGNAERLFGL